MNASLTLILLCLLAGCVSHGTGSRPNLSTIAGSWRATLDDRFHLDIEIRTNLILLTDGDAENDIVVHPHEYSFDGSTLAFAFDHSPFMPRSVAPPTPGHGTFTMSAQIAKDTMTGAGTRADGNLFKWTATRFKP